MSGENLTIISEETSSDICLYDRTGTKQTFENIETILVDTPDGIANVTFTFGKAIENAKYEPVFSNGDYIITLNKGDLLKEFTIKRPSGLKPENIVKDKEIAGIKGTHEGATIGTIVNKTLSGTFEDSTITSIPAGGLQGYSLITSLEFPNCVSIGSYAFSGCVALSSIILNENLSGIPSGAFLNTAIQGDVSFPNAGWISGSAFQGCSCIERVYAQNASPKEYAFADCINLREVHVGAASDHFQLYSYMFSGCSNLTSIKTYYSGSEISVEYKSDNDAVGAFQDCMSLESVILDSNVGNNICEKLFYNCTNLKTIAIDPSAGLTLGNYSLALRSSSYWHLSTYKTIGDRAFENCTALQFLSISFALNVCIGSSAFAGCTSLSQFYINTSSIAYSSWIVSLPESVFYNTPFSTSSYLGYYGSIYVPSSVFTWFKKRPGWSAYSARMVSY